MSEKNVTVFGIYSERSAIDGALGEFKEAGFRNTDLSVLLPQNLGSKDLGTEKTTRAPEGATAGAGSGLVLGGALGWLVGIGALAIPGLGPFIAVGPIMAALAGMGVGSAIGGFTGALIGLGIPEYEAKRYEGRIRRGGILFSVHCDNSKWADIAKRILERTGAVDIGSTSESAGDFAVSDKPYPRTVAGVSE
jgi:hypothetical protein